MKPVPIEACERVAVVTGANRGIGREVVKQLANLGFRVVLTARRGQAASKAAEELLREQGDRPGSGSVTPSELDVTNQQSVDRFSGTHETEFGRLDVLINNAGIHYDTWEHACTANIDGTVREALDTNLLGPWRIIRASLPLLRRRGGRIVNVSSEAGSLVSMRAGPPAYQVSKAALNALTRTLAGELKETGILVNSVCPGWVATEMGGSGGRPVAEGAASVVWAATLPDDGPSGGFFRDGKSLAW